MFIQSTADPLVFHSFCDITGEFFDIKVISMIDHLNFIWMGSYPLTWRSGCIMDCHAKTCGSIPGGNGVKTELRVLRRRGGGGAVSK